MSYDLDEDILQDFLVEAGEILELLSEQLVELENNPEDKDLLNAIFRGFHTVKGGAGFLALTELVDTCHGAENVFDILRNGQRSVTAGLMDTMLQALDTVNEQFQAVQEREELTPADPALLEELHRLCKPESEDEAEAEVTEVAEAEEVEETPEPVAEQPEPEPPQQSAPESNVDPNSIDEITQDEFEQLLDELHGQGAAPGKKKQLVLLLLRHLHHLQPLLIQIVISQMMNLRSFLMNSMAQEKGLQLTVLKLHLHHQRRVHLQQKNQQLQIKSQQHLKPMTA